MRLISVTVVILVLGFSLPENNSALQIEGDSKFSGNHESALSKLLTVYSTKLSGANERVKRSMKEEIEKSFKEFSDKISKLPDQLNTTLKKFFEERGISMESLQKILNEIMQAMEKLINEVKKAL